MKIRRPDGQHDLVLATRAFLVAYCGDDVSEHTRVCMESNLRLGIVGTLGRLTDTLEGATPKICQQAIDLRTEAAGPSAGHRLRRTGGQMWRRLVRDGLYDKRSPWPLTKAPKRVERRFPVEPEHAARIDSECARVIEGYSSIVPLAFAYWTRCMLRIGCRSMELQSVKIANIDFAHQEIIVPDYKEKRAGDGPKRLSAAAAMPIITELVARGLSDTWLFPSGRKSGTFIKSVHHPWKRLCELVGRPEYRIHDMRHGLAAHLSESGVDIMTIGALLGHRSIRTTQRYIGQVSRARRRAAIANINGVFKK